MTTRMQLGKRLRFGAWLPTAAWAAGAGVLAAFAATAAAAGVGSRLPADPGPDDVWGVFALVVVLAGVYAGPLAAVVAVGRGFRWWQAVLLCHAVAVASFAALLLLAPDWPGWPAGRWPRAGGRPPAWPPESVVRPAGGQPGRAPVWRADPWTGRSSASTRTRRATGWPSSNAGTASTSATSRRG